MSKRASKEQEIILTKQSTVQNVSVELPKSHYLEIVETRKLIRALSETWGFCDLDSETFSNISPKSVHLL